MEQKPSKANGLALIPFLIFIGVYLITGMVLNARGMEMAFYQLPAPIASFIGIIVAFMLFKGSFEEKLSLFLKGCGDENIMIMCMVFLFAGAFTSVSSAMGGVDSVVNLGMTVIPPHYIAAGIFGNVRIYFHIYRDFCWNSHRSNSNRTRTCKRRRSEYNPCGRRCHRRSYVRG